MWKKGDRISYRDNAGRVRKGRVTEAVRTTQGMVDFRLDGLARTRVGGRPVSR
jgi:hypothetical protein